MFSASRLMGAACLRSQAFGHRPLPSVTGLPSVKGMQATPATGLPSVTGLQATPATGRVQGCYAGVCSELHGCCNAFFLEEEPQMLQDRPQSGGLPRTSRVAQVAAQQGHGLHLPAVLHCGVAVD